LEKEGGLADTRFTAEHDGRSRNQATSERAVEFADSGGQTVDESLRDLPEPDDLSGIGAT
jgi:hypothetical protein